MGRTIQGTAEPRHPWLTTRHPIRRDKPAHQLRQTLKGRDQEGHHDPEEWEGCRTGWDTSRSHQSRHRDSCQHAIQPLQQDLGEGGPAQWKEGIIIKLPNKILGTAETIEGSCSCQRQARFSTGFYWRGWRGLLTLRSETSKQAFGGTDLVPSRSPACAWSWNSHWSVTHPSTSTS